jgi:HD-GYP domain-containing protein (c-di-GMP phosphodiesterase class II)
MRSIERGPIAKPGLRRPEQRRALQARSLLESLPDSVYRELPSARITSELCSAAVSRAVRFRNPREVCEWLSYECSGTPAGALLACLDTALQLEAGGTVDRRAASLAGRIIVEARTFLADTLGSSVLRNAEPSIDAFIEGVLCAIDAFDERLSRHSADVARTARRMADVARCADEETELIWNAARVHEIGRLRVDRDLADSSRILDDDERDAIRVMLADVQTLRRHPACESIADTIGQSYRTQPTLATRAANILKVADAFHALCEPRPHRPARAPRAALEELQRRCGTSFDAAAVETLMSVLEYTRPYAWSA